MATVALDSLLHKERVREGRVVQVEDRRGLGGKENGQRQERREIDWRAVFNI